MCRGGWIWTSRRAVRRDVQRVDPAEIRGRARTRGSQNGLSDLPEGRAKVEAPCIPGRGLHDPARAGEAQGLKGGKSPGQIIVAIQGRGQDPRILEREDGETDESLGARIKSAREKAAHAAEEAGHRIEAAAAKAKHAAEAAMAEAVDTVKHAGEKVKDAASAGRSQYEENPALAIAISTAVGALIGTLAPMSKKEEELLSEPVDKAAEKLAAGARATAETAQRAAERIHEATRGVRKAEAEAEAAAGHHM